MPTAVPITAKPLRALPVRAPDRPIRQFAVLALAAFAIGFVSFVALGRPLAVAAEAADPPAVVVVQPADEPRAMSPASEDWNLPKRI